MKKLRLSLISCLLLIISSSIFSSSTFLNYQIEGRKEFQIKKKQYLITDIKKGVVKHNPNNIIRHRLEYKKEVIYDVVYNINRWGRRFVPQQKKKHKLKHIVLLGDSFVFGHGLNENDTLPYYLSKELEGFRVYNWGMKAAGLFKLVRNIEFSNIREEIQEKEGVFIVMLPPWCEARSRGLELLKGDIKPHYEIDNTHKIRYIGVLDELFPIRTSFVRFVRNSFMFQKFPRKAYIILNNLFMTNDFYNVYAKVLAALKDIYIKKFKRGTFIFLEFPHQNIKHSSFLLSQIEKEGIYILKINSPIFSDKDKILPNIDNHPTGKYNKKLALKLSKFILANQNLN